MKHLLCLLILSTAAFSQAAKKQDELTFYVRHGSGEELVGACKKVENVDITNNKAPLADVGLIQSCVGFIDGVVDAETFSSSAREVPGIERDNGKRLYLSVGKNRG